MFAPEGQPSCSGAAGKCEGLRTVTQNWCCGDTGGRALQHCLYQCLTHQCWSPGSARKSPGSPRGALALLTPLRMCLGRDFLRFFISHKRLTSKRCLKCAPGLHSPWRGRLLGASLLAHPARALAAQPCHTGPWLSPGWRMTQGPVGGGGGRDPPSAAGELKQSVYHGKTALCSNSNGNFPE